MRVAFLVAVIAVFALSISAQSSPRAAMNSKVFESVWSTVNEKFYDPNFNGVDWQAARETYAPRAAAASTDVALYKVINEMLTLLKVSHMEAGPAASVKKPRPPTATGLSLRMIDGRLVVARLIPGFPGEKAGVKLGYVLANIEGAVPTDVDDARAKLQGQPGTTVKVTFLDESDHPREFDLERQGLTDKDSGKMAGLKLYALFDSRRLDGGIAYIWFSSFIPFLNDRIQKAMVSMQDAPGMILDLRGNGGGDDEVAIGIANRLFAKPVELMVTKRRNGEDHYYKAKPAKNAYLGKLVILVDGLSASASEQLTAGLQEAGRAYVIGTKTAAEDLDANLKMLPDGGMLVYAYGLPHTPKDVVIEGRGVIPDQIVELKRADLLAGHDTQLDAAIRYLQQR